MRISSRRTDTFDESSPRRLGGLDCSLSDFSAELGVACVASDESAAHFDVENTASLGSLATLDLPLLEGASLSFDAHASMGKEDESLSSITLSFQNLQLRQPHPLFGCKHMQVRSTTITMRLCSK